MVCLPDKEVREKANTKPSADPVRQRSGELIDTEVQLGRARSRDMRLTRHDEHRILPRRPEEKREGSVSLVEV